MLCLNPGHNLCLRRSRCISNWAPIYAAHGKNSFPPASGYEFIKDHLDTMSEEIEKLKSELAAVKAKKSDDWVTSSLRQFPNWRNKSNRTSRNPWVNSKMTLLLLKAHWTLSTARISKTLRQYRIQQLRVIRRRVFHKCWKIIETFRRIQAYVQDLMIEEILDLPTMMFPRPARGRKTLTITGNAE